MTLARTAISWMRRMAPPVVSGFLLLQLAGCTQQPWRIEKILINPADPLVGNATILPLDLVAGESREVGVEVAIKRTDGFNDLVLFGTEVDWNPPDGRPFRSGGLTFPTARIPAGSTRGIAPLVLASCEHVSSGAEPSVSLNVTHNPGVNEGSVHVTGVAEARTNLDVHITSRAGNFEVFGHADRLFEIICRRDRPATLGTACSSNARCASGYCDSGHNTANTGLCMPRGGTGVLGNPCSHDTQCASDRCAGLHQDPDGRWQTGTCQSKLALGDPCQQNNHCASSYCDHGNNTAATDRCMPRGGTGSAGDFCSHPSQCRSGSCAGLTRNTDGSWNPGRCS